MFSSLAASALLLLPAFITAQTYTKCNPLQGTCPADPALGTSKSIDFTSASSDFTVSGGTASYSSNGAALSVAKQGDAPTLTSKWYIMFGKVEITMKAAPGTGIVSSAVLQSDDLDEIDWEWLGGDSAQVQSNYFGKGITGGYNRGAFHSDPTSQSDYNTYTVDWSSEQVVWSINGQSVRVLTPAAAGNQYPQTPMQVKLGVWAGGDPSNSPGTISWAGGQTNYGAGPYTMYVKSVKVTDYSTGTQYQYGDTSGSWQSIKAIGGTVAAGAPSGTLSSATPVVSTTSGQPSPFDGTHANPSSTYVNPSVYPWISSATTLATSSIPCYTGLPSGWTCSSNGKALPPSSASLTFQSPSSTQLVSATPLASSSSSSSSITAPKITASPSIAPFVGNQPASSGTTVVTSIRLPINGTTTSRGNYSAISQTATATPATFTGGAATIHKQITGSMAGAILMMGAGLALF